MNLATKEKLMCTAIQEAQNAIAMGNSPFGAVLCNKEGEVIERAHNTTNTDTNPTAHAEINLIRKATKKLQSKDLSEYILISNVQSCPMCVCAAVKSKITHFIFGCAEDATLLPPITVFEINKYCKNTLTIETGILQQECEEQLNKARNAKR